MSLSYWALDALMELINKNVKELNFPNNIEAWRLHSKDVMLAQASSTFIKNEYSTHRSIKVQDAKLA